MSLSLTSLDDAYISDMDVVAPQPTIPIPSLPNHGKKERPVSLREELLPINTKQKSRKAKSLEIPPVTESFTDKVWSHKKDMMKMLTLALIIASGLAFHHVFLDFLNEYLEGARLSYWNEKITKLCYPAIVLALIWCLKSMK